MDKIFFRFELPGRFNPGTAHLKKGRKFREKSFCRYPQFRFVLDDAAPSVEHL
jgi:hypothetical protein